MSKPAFGQIIDPDVPHRNRDAVHIPIIKVRACTYLAPGAPITLIKFDTTNIGAKRAEGSDYSAVTAIVDPFLRASVEPGQLFYAWMKPDSTQNLWHDWTHHAVDKPAAIKES